MERPASYVVKGQLEPVSQLLFNQVPYGECHFFHFPGEHVFIISVEALSRMILMSDIQIIIGTGFNFAGLQFALVIPMPKYVHPHL